VKVINSPSVVFPADRHGKDIRRMHHGAEVNSSGDWMLPVRPMPRVMGARHPGAAGVTRRALGKFATAAVCGCGRSRLRLSCRLYSRLIRVGSLTFARYRVKFSTQVKDGGE
jgi:hypothetical protein